ncbi:MAG: M67 family metallopeptidase [Tannerellaceae bacterium]|jgi:proteasome lid subunit RPN8/RPN11|nr:M67 family metallopeptidase [Tannerellaceae bacterium]
MIVIPQHIQDAIIRQACNELPDEACGLLTGTGNRVQAYYPLTNIDHSPEHFSFDPHEQFEVLKEARSQGLQIIAGYHSHPSSPARPSAEDIRLAYDPHIFYLIVSLAGEAPLLKAFRIVHGVAEEVEVVRTNENNK